jgi:hypothetical protein
MTEEGSIMQLTMFQGDPAWLFVDEWPALVCRRQPTRECNDSTFKTILPMNFDDAYAGFSGTDLCQFQLICDLGFSSFCPTLQTRTGFSGAPFSNSFKPWAAWGRVRRAPASTPPWSQNIMIPFLWTGKCPAWGPNVRTIAGVIDWLLVLFLV